MTLSKQSGVGLEGTWDFTWRPLMMPPLTGTLTVTRDGDVLFVEIETPAGVGRAETTVDSGRSSWSVTIGALPGPLHFEVEADGDVFVGTAAVEGASADRFALDGVRSGSGAVVPYREASDAAAETLRRRVGSRSASATRQRRGLGAQPRLARLSRHGRADGALAGLDVIRLQPGQAPRGGGDVDLVGRRPARVPGGPRGVPRLDPAADDQHRAPVALRRCDGLQDSTLLTYVFKPLAKHHQRIVDGEDMPVAIRQAVLAASTGKFGPAVLSVTQTAMLQKTTLKTEPFELPLPPAPSAEAVRRTVELLEAAERPVLLVGAGVHLADATAELRALSRRQASRWSPAGPRSRALPDDHPLYGGDISPWATSRPAPTWPRPPTCGSRSGSPSRTRHAVVEPRQAGEGRARRRRQRQLDGSSSPTVGIVSDAKAFLTILRAAIEAKGIGRSTGEAARVAEIAKAKDAHLEKLRSFVDVDPIRPAAIGQALAAELPPETIIVNDEGFSVPGMVFAEEKYPQGHAPAMGFHYASLGSTLPVAIGAKLASRSGWSSASVVTADSSMTAAI